MPPPLPWNAKWDSGPRVPGGGGSLHAGGRQFRHPAVAQEWQVIFGCLPRFRMRYGEHLPFHPHSSLYLTPAFCLLSFPFGGLSSLVSFSFSVYEHWGFIASRSAEAWHGNWMHKVLRTMSSSVLAVPKPSVPYSHRGYAFGNLALLCPAHGSPLDHWTFPVLEL